MLHALWHSEINSTEFSWLLKLIGSNSEHGIFSSEMCTDILSNLLKIKKSIISIICYVVNVAKSTVSTN